MANATVDRLLAEDVDGFIGAASSGVSLTVIDKITQAGKIHFSPANTSPTFTDYDDNGLYFRTAPSDVVQGAALADIMIADGNASATFLVLNDAYGTGLLEFTKGPFEAQGGVVDAENIYDPKAENFDDVVADAVEADSDAIVIIGFDETSKILTGLIEAGFGPDAKSDLRHRRQHGQRPRRRLRRPDRPRRHARHASRASTSKVQLDGLP